MYVPLFSNLFKCTFSEEMKFQLELVDVDFTFDAAEFIDLSIKSLVLIETSLGPCLYIKETCGLYLPHIIGKGAKLVVD